MGLLDYLTTDKDKQEALRLGLLNAGVNMMSSQSPNLMGSIGGGAGAGIGAYQKAFDEHKKKLAMQQALASATTPGHAATSESYRVGGTTYDSRDKAQAAASPYTASLPRIGSDAPLMPNVMQASAPLDRLSFGNRSPSANMASNPTAVPVNNSTPGYFGALSPDRQDIQGDQQQIETIPGQAEQAGSVDYQKLFMGALTNPDTPPELQKLALQWMSSQTPKQVKYGDVKFSGDGKAYAIGDDGSIKWVDGVTPRDKLVADNLGGSNVYRTEYSATPVATATRTASPDSVMTDARQRFEGQMNRGVAMRGQDMTDSRAQANNPNLFSGSPTSTTSGVSGQQFLDTLNKPIADQVKALAEGRMQFPAGFALKSPYWQNMISAVSQYDPSFDAINYNARSKTRNDFTAGKAANNINGINTVIGHLGQLSDASDELKNSRFPLWNTATNTVATQKGDSRIKQFDITRKAVVDELTRVYRQSGGSEKDIEEWTKQLNASGSPDQLHGAIAQIGGLLQSKIQAMNDQYTKGMGTSGGGLQMLSPHAQQALQVLESRNPDKKQPAGQSGNTVTAPNGKTYSFPTAEAADKFRKNAGF